MPITLADHYVLYTCIETSQWSTRMYSYYSSIEMEGKLSHSQGCRQEEQESKASLGCRARCCLRRERKVPFSHISSQNTGTESPCQWASPQSSVSLVAIGSTPTPSPRFRGCDSVSCCLTPSAVVHVLLPDLLRVRTNCRFLLDLPLEDIRFQQPANVLGAAEALLPWLNGGFGGAFFLGGREPRAG